MLAVTHFAGAQHRREPPGRKGLAQHLHLGSAKQSRELDTVSPFTQYVYHSLA